MLALSIAFLYVAITIGVFIRERDNRALRKSGDYLNGQVDGLTKEVFKLKMALGKMKKSFSKESEYRHRFDVKLGQESRTHTADIENIFAAIEKVSARVGKAESVASSLKSQLEEFRRIESSWRGLTQDAATKFGQMEEKHDALVAKIEYAQGLFTDKSAGRIEAIESRLASIDGELGRRLQTDRDLARCIGVLSGWQQTAATQEAMDSVKEISE